MEQTPGKSKKYKHLESIQKESGSPLLFSQQLTWKNNFHGLLKLITHYGICSYLEVYCYIYFVVQIIIYYMKNI